MNTDKLIMLKKKYKKEQKRLINIRGNLRVISYEWSYYAGKTENISNTVKDLEELLR